MRTLLQAVGEGNGRAGVAIEVFCYRLAKAILGLSAALDRIDALVFTGGIGENSSPVRARTLNNLRVLGAKLDEELNEQHGKSAAGRITTQDSGLLALVVPTNEELVIARETARFLTSTPFHNPMPHTLYLAPSGAKVGLTSVALGLVRALDNRGVRVAFCKPIGQPAAKATGPERSTHFIRATTSLRPALPISLEEAERLISSERTDELLERVMRDFHESASDADVVVVEGLAHSSDMPLGATLNVQLVKTLSAQVILTGSLAGLSMEEFDERLEVSGSQYGGLEGGAVIGCIINHVPDSQKLSLAELRDSPGGEEPGS